MFISRYVPISLKKIMVCICINNCNTIFLYHNSVGYCHCVNLFIILGNFSYINAFFSALVDTILCTFLGMN